jgi:hypothetical protein
LEWPRVVGSRCSIAATAAWTKVSKSVDPLDQVGVLEGDGRLAGERDRQLLVDRGERDHLLFDERHRPQHGAVVALLVDQLDDTDHRVLVVAHRNHQHRLGAVARDLVERTADVEGRVRSQAIGVRDVLLLAVTAT